MVTAETLNDYLQARLRHRYAHTYMAHHASIYSHAVIHTHTYKHTYSIFIHKLMVYNILMLSFQIARLNQAAARKLLTRFLRGVRIYLRTVCMYV